MNTSSFFASPLTFAYAGDSFDRPLLLGGGKALFDGVKQRRSLRFVDATPGPSGRLIVTYRV